jgi:hypothetical protein
MKYLLYTFLAFSLFLTGAAAQTKRPNKTKTKQTNVQTSDKISYEPDAALLRGLQEKVEIIESEQDWEELNEQSALINPARTRTAYTAEFKMENEREAMIEVIVIADKTSGEMFEIRGFDDFPWRPFSDFKWITNDILQFEQWVNPSNGGRYRINLKTGKIVAAGFVRSN